MERYIVISATAMRELTWPIIDRTLRIAIAMSSIAGLPVTRTLSAI